MTLAPSVLVPVDITAAMVTASSISEPDASMGEVAWTTPTAYAVGDVVIRTTTHRKYKCAVAHTSAAAPLPENDSTRWTDVGATNKYACFDRQRSTQSIGVEPLTFTSQPGFCNAIAIYDLDGASIDITVKDAPGGNVITHYVGDLYEPPLDWYEWLFSPYKNITKIIVSSIVPWDTLEITVTITAAVGVTVKCGKVVIGDLRSLISDAEWGGPEYGAKASPVSNSYVKIELDGTATITRRRAATDMSLRIKMPREIADYALATVQEVLDVPCAWIATDLGGYNGLNVYGLGTGDVSYDSFRVGTLTLNVKGLV